MLCGILQPSSVIITVLLNPTIREPTSQQQVDASEYRRNRC